VGVSISLLFVRGPSVEETLSALALIVTAERSGLPPERRRAIALVHLPSGFHMLWSNTCDERRFTKAARARLSERGEVALQSLEEHVMFSHIEYWRGGAQRWSVSHAGDIDDKDLTFTGEPPELFDALRREETSPGHDGNFFDIAVRMGDQLTGYAYDREYDWDKGLFAVLDSAASAKRPFWKFW